jgi:hypothetical protein
MNSLQLRLLRCCAALFAGIIPAAAITITPTWTTSINNDVNSAAIKGTINTAIAFYESIITDNINVNITFQEGSGLGGSSFALHAVDYTTFRDALIADGKSSDDATALARLALDGGGSNNPVSGTTTVLLKSANMKALGIPVSATSDGTITLNTALTTPGSPGSSSQYSLLSVVEHEIDEILGLGSSLGLGLPKNYPSPEDFFRFSSSNTRSFDPSTGITSYFSIDGTTLLAQFNQTGSGDYGDWASTGTVRVQDAFATPGTNPTLGVELRALDVIGYDLVSVPEPATFLLSGSALLLAIALRRKQS